MVGWAAAAGLGDTELLVAMVSDGRKKKERGGTWKARSAKKTVLLVVSRSAAICGQRVNVTEDG